MPAVRLHRRGSERGKLAADSGYVIIGGDELDFTRRRRESPSPLESHEAGRILGKRGTGGAEGETPLP